jgi:hypothetical protein
LAPPAGAQDQPYAPDIAKMRAEAQPCLADGRPVSSCTFDAPADWLVLETWEAVVRRVTRARGSFLQITRDPDSEGYGLPIESISLIEAAEFGDSHSPGVSQGFLRRSISTREIGRLANEAWNPELVATRLQAVGLSPNEAVTTGRYREVLPDVDALAARAAMEVEVAWIDACPGVSQKLDALEPLLTQSFDVTGVGRDRAPGPFTFDGYVRVLRATGLFTDGSLGTIEYRVDDAHPLAQWQDEMFELLKPCWRQAASELQ